MTIEDLVERVRGLTGPDREVDCRIAYTLDYEVESMPASFRSYCDVHDLNWGEIARHANSHQSILRHSLPRFTASIDAALALAERVLPGWQVNLSTYGPFAEASVGAMDAFNRFRAPTAPIAILVATLATLIAIQSSETSNADRS